MRIMHIVGNRPQFIKLAPVSAEIKKRDYDEIIIHTGQHFDENMSSVFFDEMDIPRPDENLGISGGSHAQMTGEMIKSIEGILLKHDPDVVFVYGDTNSTLAAAITARKLGYKAAHIESGPRTGCNDNPEEINRKAVDHISDFLFAPDKNSFNNLIREGQGDHSFFTGDVMYDAYRLFSEKAKSLTNTVINTKDKYILMTWHRQENTSDPERMNKILNYVNKLKVNVICPLHPRTKKMLNCFGLWEKACGINNLIITEPVGYLEMLKLLNGCEFVLTDSGGLSKESFFAKKCCIFMADLIVWPELEKIGYIVHMDDSHIKLPIVKNPNDYSNDLIFGDGSASEKILDIIENCCR